MSQTPSPPDRSVPKTSGGARRWLVRSALFLLALLALAAMLLLAAVKTEPGARALWKAAARAVPGQLSGEVVGGTLADGVRLRDVVYRDDKRQLKIDRLAASWRWSRSPLTWTIDRLQIGELDVTQYPAPKQPPTVPNRLTLPLAIELRDATLQKLVIRRDSGATALTDIALRAHTDGVQHALTLERAATPYGTARARLKLNGIRPFAVDGSASLDGTWRDESYSLAAKLSGSLQALHAQLDATGQGAARNEPAHIGGKARIEADLFSDNPLLRAQVALRHLDPRMFRAGAPHADLDIDANLVPEAGSAHAAPNAPLVLAGPVSLRNAQSGPLDRDLLPIVSASAQVRLGTKLQQLRQLQAELAGGGTLEGGGELRAGTGRFTLQTDALDLHALHGKLQHTRLSGPLTVDFAGDTQHVALDLAGSPLAIAGAAQIGPQQITLNSAVLRAGKAQLRLSGKLERGAQGAFSARGTLSDFDPKRFLASPKVPAARINMQFDAQGMLKPELQARLAFAIHDSTYSGLPMTGGGRLNVHGKRVAAQDTRLSVAGNQLRLSGSFGTPGERLTFDLDAPALARLGFGLSGQLRAAGRIGGTVERPEIDADYQASRLAFQQYRLAEATGQLHASGMSGRTPDARVTLELEARGAQAPDISLSALQVSLDGSADSHALSLKGNGHLRGRPLALTVAAHGRLQQQNESYAWQGTLDALENRGFPRLALERPLALRVASGQLTLGATRLTLERARIDLQSVQVDQQAIRSAGAFSALDVSHLLELRRELSGAAPPFKTDLVLDGSWDFSLADSASGFAQVERRSGDIRIPGELRDTAMGMTALRLRGDLKGSLLTFSAQAAARRVGSASGTAQVALVPVDGRLAPVPDSALAGRITASIPRLLSLAALAGPRIALDGSIAAEMKLSGTLAAPVASGDATGTNLSLSVYDQGIRLDDGSAYIHIEDNIADIRQLEFHGGEGTLRATGRIPLEHSHDLTATVIADKLQLLANPSRQMTVSGRAEAGQAGGQMQITGQFKADQARFSLPEQSAPALGDDVTIVRGSRQDAAARAPQRVALQADKPAGPLTPRVRVQLDLGDDFRFKGSGADLTLAGNLTVTSAPGEPPRAYGTVRITGGTYEAFGAELEIERGVINFQGSFTNPSIDILAMRRQQDVAAGVHATGSVRQPRVQLVSEPDVPEQEKLNWLVFGRGGGTSGDAGPGQAQAAARSAALGLVNKFGGSRIAKGFGLDQLAIGSSEFGLGAQQVVSLGKEISNRLYIGYEQSLAGAEGVLKLTYDLSRHWSVVLRGGTIGGLDVFYSKRFDTLGEPRESR
ncbi:translocation/assembly module TamB domain-containing protein [Noviherbaspirillum autotrophicum]|nr:translocation/assembly module TamB domain-containing protein [Noviherbaspirillum autotrophicum]